jgi:hypothetical protein
MAVSKEYRMHRSMANRVLMDSWVATSLGVPWCGVEDDGPEVDVLVELAAESQQDVFLQYPRSDFGVADRA